MTEDYSDELAQQLEKIHTTLETVSDLQKEIKNVGDELKDTGRLSKLKLETLAEMAATATASLNNLADATGFLNELTSGRTAQQLKHLLNEFQTSGLPSLPHVLESLKATSGVLDSQVQKQTTDLDALIERFTKFGQSPSEEDTTVERLYLVAPAALIGTIFGVTLLDLSLLKSATWTALTLILIVAGFPGRRVITELWNKIKSI